MADPHGCTNPPPLAQCLTHTHQLGIDMQLFLVAPLLVYPLWRWPRGGALFLAALAAWSTALRYSVVIDNELSTIVYFGVSYVPQRKHAPCIRRAFSTSWSHLLSFCRAR